MRRGLGSAKMDGAIMHIGYGAGDETELKVQKGAGHRHANTETNAPALYAMKQAGGQTVLEHKARVSISVALAQ
jgi:hypothetical protein